jgi:protein-S-isoprenylcysteine O-methyltransferase Ste14
MMRVIVSIFMVVAFEYERERRKYCPQTRNRLARAVLFGFDNPGRVRLWLKARSEEQFLRIELGPEFYRAYCRRVPMIVPFITPGERASRRPRANQ